jgi:hypothetical protein
VGQEVRADGLDVAAGGSRELADGLEVLVGRPAGREGRQSLVDLRYRHIDVGYGSRYKRNERSRCSLEKSGFLKTPGSFLSWQPVRPLNVHHNHNNLFALQR